MSPSGGAITLVDQPITVIAAEQDALSRHGETKMVRRMSRGVDCLELPATAGDRIAVVHGHVGREIPIPAFLDRRLAAPASGMGAKTIGRGTGRRSHCRRRRRMVAMGMGDQDMGHPLAGEAGQQCRDVLVEIRAGIDDRDLALADYVGPGALEGKRARIARDDTANARRHPLKPTIFERKLAAERDLGSHRRRLHEIPRATQRLR